MPWNSDIVRVISCLHTDILPPFIYHVDGYCLDTFRSSFAVLELVGYGKVFHWRHQFYDIYNFLFFIYTFELVVMQVHLVVVGKT